MAKKSGKEKARLVKRQNHLSAAEQIIEILNDHATKNGPESAINVIIDAFVHFFVWTNTKGRLPVYSKEQMGIGIVQKAFDELSKQSQFLIPYGEEESDGKKEDVSGEAEKKSAESGADKEATESGGKGLLH